MLREGPAWAESEGRLYFDVASGDFWVLAGEAEQIVRQAMQAPALQVEASATVDALLAAGLLHAEGPRGG